MVRMTIATCQNCKSDFTIDKYRLKKRILLGRVFCKECSYKIAAKEADYKDRRRKAAKTNKEKFGFENPMKADAVKSKMHSTKMMRYGDPNYGKIGTPEWNKMINDRFGVENVAELPKIVERRKSTLKRRSGYEYALQNPESLKKAENTCIARRGKTLQECTLGTVSKNRIEYDGHKFDSSWEVEYYKYCKAHGIDIIRNEGQYSFEYSDNNGKKHKYYPDFYLPGTNEMIEIKGDVFLNENDEILDFNTMQPNAEKTECVKRNARLLRKKDLIAMGIKIRKSK